MDDILNRIEEIKKRIEKIDSLMLNNDIDFPEKFGIAHAQAMLCLIDIDAIEEKIKEDK